MDKFQSNQMVLTFFNCHVFSGAEEDELMADAVITTRVEQVDGRPVGVIDSIRPRAEGEVLTPGLDRIDLEGAYVIPGLINAHCHLFSDGNPISGTSNHTLVNLFLTLIGRWPFKTLFKMKVRRTLENTARAGVTTLRCVGDPHYLDLELKAENIRKKAFTPRLVCAGLGIGTTGGHANALSIQSDSPWEARKAVRTNLREGVDFIKLFSTGGAADSKKKGEAGRLQMTPAEIESACDEAHRAGYKVATHAQSTQGIAEALRSGVDSIEHGAYLSDEVIELFKRNDKSLAGHSALVVTLSPIIHLAQLDAATSKVSQSMIENVRIIGGGMLEGFRRALQGGVMIGIGNDASMPTVTHYDFWRELYYVAKYGDIPAKKVIYHATKVNAQILGIDSITGHLAPGLSADMAIYRDNPLEDLRALAQPWKVVIEGRVIQDQPVRRFRALEAELNRIMALSDEASAYGACSQPV